MSLCINPLSQSIAKFSSAFPSQGKPLLVKETWVFLTAVEALLHCRIISLYAVNLLDKGIYVNIFRWISSIFTTRCIISIYYAQVFTDYENLVLQKRGAHRIRTPRYYGISAECCKTARPGLETCLTGPVLFFWSRALTVLATC